MAERDLMFSINFEGNMTDLVDMNSAVDDVKENALSASDDIGQMEQATDDLGDSTGRNSNLIADNWMAVTGGMVAVSAGAEGITRSNAGLFESIEKVSRSTGMQRDELQDLALDLTNVTFPLEDVTELMETGVQQGLESADQLADYATFWDTVGDATGLAGPKLAEASAGLRAVGIDAGNESEALEAFGYITESTTGNVDEFLTFLEKTGPELRDMGVGINDSAGMLGILEKEFGMSGRTARQQFRKAVNEADGDLEKMYDTLGISEEMMAEYRAEVEGSGDVIQDFADIHGETYTVTEKLGQKVSELGFKYGDTIRAVSDFAPILSAIGPVAKGAQMAQEFLGSGLLTGLIPAFTSAISGAWAFTTALLANPITWIVVGVIALGVAIWALATDFGGVTTFIKEKLGQFTEWMSGKLSAMGEFVREKFNQFNEWMTEKITALVDWFKTKASEFIQVGSDFIINIIAGVSAMWGSLNAKASEVVTSVVQAFKSKVSDFLSAGKEFITAVISGIASMAGSLVSVATNLINSVVRTFQRVVSNFKNIGRDVISGFITGFTDRAKALKKTVVDTASNVSSWFKGKLGISSPSKVFIDHGEDTVEGADIGMRKKMPNLFDTTKDMATGLDNIGLGGQTIGAGANFNPTINITINGEADDKAVENLEHTIKRVIERERKSFFNNMNLQRA